MPVYQYADPARYLANSFQNENVEQGNYYERYQQHEELGPSVSLHVENGFHAWNVHGKNA